MIRGIKPHPAVALTNKLRTWRIWYYERGVGLFYEVLKATFVLYYGVAHFGKNNSVGEIDTHTSVLTRLTNGVYTNCFGVTAASDRFFSQDNIEIY